MSPAYERRFTETPPRTLFLDTSFVIASLVGGEREERHEECLSFGETLLEAGTTVVYSRILRVEYLNAWRRLILEGFLPPEPGPQVRLRLGVLRAETAHWLRLADILLRRFLSQFPRVEVRLNNTVVDEMLTLMGNYNLKAQDAVHVASAFYVGCSDIASLDPDFRWVDGIRLWNNRPGNP